LPGAQTYSVPPLSVTKEKKDYGVVDRLYCEKISGERLDGPAKARQRRRRWRRRQQQQQFRKEVLKEKSRFFHFQLQQVCWFQPIKIKQQVRNHLDTFSRESLMKGKAR
jgi:hypothetical protein